MKGQLIRDAWQNRVWNQPSVLAITDKIFLYDITQSSQSEIAELLYETKVNFFTCKVVRSSVPQIMGGVRYLFRVEVAYFLQQDQARDSTYNLVNDRLELVDDLVLSSLKSNWNSKVDFYEGSEPQDITEITIDDRVCWRGGYAYGGTKQ